MKRLVLLVEGEGDVLAALALIARLLNFLPVELQGHLFPDKRPMRIKGLESNTGNRQNDFLRYVQLAARKPDTAGVLVILDGDADMVEGKPFCPAQVARVMAERASTVGAGKHFSLGVVFLCKEYESILISVADQLPKLRAGTQFPPNIELSPRDAKGWLDKYLEDGYRSGESQLLHTRAVADWQPARSLRSFRRLERAIQQIAEAVVNSAHVATPLPPEHDMTG